MVKSFVEIMEYLFSIPGMTKFLSGWLSQDSLKNFFGCQHQQNKSSENPNVHDFAKIHRCYMLLTQYAKMSLGAISEAVSTALIGKLKVNLYPSEESVCQ